MTHKPTPDTNRGAMLARRSMSHKLSGILGDWEAGLIATVEDAVAAMRQHLREMPKRAARRKGGAGRK